MYRAGDRAGTGAAGARAFGGPTSLGAGVPFSGLVSCSGSLGLTVLDGTFFRERKPHAILAERSWVLSN